MAKIKFTKNELKNQRDALARYRRFLPTLQLKKQSLQNEVRNLRRIMEEKEKEERGALERMDSWVRLFSEDFDFTPFVRPERVETGRGNIVGVRIPLLKEVRFPEAHPDYRETPAWVDEGVRTLRHLITLRLERMTLERQYELLNEELTTTTQRVNLFEKVKIPECLENIRRINIFLGDEQTAAVARSKIAKAKMRERETAS
ncbi:V-type ATP synthase subunit D [Desulfohalovibrio reitneri]|uniref:V-type ATP synthase subunit D n=1 Tax=Desulfohalovibrio reitneri TaxID=1307759 RepID=UPI0004A74005|nr:V-type ATP synthase subunit D [Desulfohalovibrio reitneri]